VRRCGGDIAVSQVIFRVSIHASVAKIQPDKGVRWCADREFLAIFCAMYFQRATCSTLQTCILNLQGHTMCGSMVDIQSVTVDNRRGKKTIERKKKEETTGQNYNGLPYSIGRP